MDDLGLNKYLEETYGKTIEGFPLFRLVWTTDQLEKRLGTFRDFSDHSCEIFLREVTEVREVPKYPFAMDRWALEVIKPVEKEYGIMDAKYTYEAFYFFQDKYERELELSKEMLEAAMYMYLVYYRMPMKDKVELQMQNLAAREAERKEHIRQAIGAKMRSPLFMVLENPKGGF